MPNSNGSTNVLVVWDRPDDFHELLVARFPKVKSGVNFEFVSQPDQAHSVLEWFHPSVVFSVKAARFPLETHRIAIGAPSVEWVQVGGSGYDHLYPIDLSRFIVTNCAGVLAKYLAETLTGAMLALNGHFFRYHLQQQKKQWQAISFKPLSEQTLLVVGLGQIGKCVADNAKALGMRVLAVKRDLSDYPSVDRMYTLDQLSVALGQADFVSLHLRLNEDTEGIIDESMLNSMKSGAYLINTARGPIVDSKSFIQAVQSGHLAGAYLDVFDTEPLPPDDQLWQLDNVFITPHASDSVHQWPKRFAEFFADNLDRWLKREPLMNEV